MIIDMLTHIGKRRGEVTTIEELIEIMDKSGVDKAMACSQLEHIDNEYIAEAQQKYPDRILGFAVVNPWAMDGELELERCFTDYNFYGLKINALRYGYSIDRHSLIDSYFELCKKHNKAVVGHAMSDLFSLPAKWEEMARTFPEVSFILTHIGIPLMVDDACRIAKRNENVFLNTAVTFEPAVRRAIEIAGPEKVVLGTDAPYGSMVQHIDVIKRSVSDEKAREMILGGNMKKLFKF